MVAVGALPVCEIHYQNQSVESLKTSDITPPPSFKTFKACRQTQSVQNMETVDITQSLYKARIHTRSVAIMNAGGTAPPLSCMTRNARRQTQSVKSIEPYSISSEHRNIKPKHTVVLDSNSQPRSVTGMKELAREERQTLHRVCSSSYKIVVKKE